ncbi:chitinase, partial [Cronobacter sakazakii]|nr:chitinase [Cronobacter sakazakii]
PTPTPTPTPDTGSAPYPLWDAGTIYGAKWGSFEKVSWKGHNYQVNWYSQGEQPDLNCGPYQVWTDIGTY